MKRSSYEHLYNQLKTGGAVGEEKDDELVITIYVTGFGDFINHNCYTGEVKEFMERRNYFKYILNCLIKDIPTKFKLDFIYYDPLLIFNELTKKSDFDKKLKPLLIEEHQIISHTNVFTVILDFFDPSKIEDKTKPYIIFDFAHLYLINEDFITFNNKSYLPALSPVIPGEIPPVIYPIEYLPNSKYMYKIIHKIKFFNITSEGRITTIDQLLHKYNIRPLYVKIIRLATLYNNEPNNYTLTEAIVFCHEVIFLCDDAEKIRLVLNNLFIEMGQIRAIYLSYGIYELDEENIKREMQINIKLKEEMIIYELRNSFKIR